MGRFDTSPQDTAWYREHARHHLGRRLALSAGALLIIFGGGALLRAGGSPGWGRVLLLVLELILVVAVTVVTWRWFRTSLAHNDPYLRKRHPHWDDTGTEPTRRPDSTGQPE